MPKLTDKDFTPYGTKIEGQYENDRNAESAQLFKDILKEALGVDQVIIAHHIVYVMQDQDKAGFKIQVVEEIPSADTLLFDHDIAEEIWGDDYLDVLAELAKIPQDHRDARAKELFYSRKRIVRNGEDHSL